MDEEKKGWDIGKKIRISAFNLPRLKFESLSAGLGLGVIPNLNFRLIAISVKWIIGVVGIDAGVFDVLFLSVGDKHLGLRNGNEGEEKLWDKGLRFLFEFCWSKNKKINLLKQFILNIYSLKHFLF